MMLKKLPDNVANGKFKQSDLVQLRMCDRELLVEQGDINTFESSMEINRINPVVNSIGWINHQGDDIPVYYLDKNLDLVTNANELSSICVILNHVNIALLCDDIKVFNEVVISNKGLPLCMQVTNVPFTSLCIYSSSEEVKLGLIFSAQSLGQYITVSNRVAAG